MVDGGYTTSVWLEMEGTRERVKDRKRRVAEILSRHNAGGSEFTLLFDMMFNEPVGEEHYRAQSVMQWWYFDAILETMVTGG